jgi:Type III secretory pathway, component EscS
MASFNMCAYADIFDASQPTLWLILILSLPALVVSLVVGLVISLLQALTQSRSRR